MWQRPVPPCTDLQIIQLPVLERIHPSVHVHVPQLPLARKHSDERTFATCMRTTASTSAVRSPHGPSGPTAHANSVRGASQRSSALVRGKGGECATAALAHASTPPQLVCPTTMTCWTLRVSTAYASTEIALSSSRWTWLELRSVHGRTSAKAQRGGGNGAQGWNGYRDETHFAMLR